MLLGATGQSLCMIVLAITTRPVYEGRRDVGIAAAFMLFISNTFFAIGWLGITWLYPAEITPLSIRAPANAISTTAKWIFNSMVVMQNILSFEARCGGLLISAFRVTPPAFASIRDRTNVIFAVINAFMVPSVYFFFPETAYRSLEEMDEIFHKTTSPFNVVKIAKHMPHRFGKNGELLTNYEDTEEYRSGMRRRSSVPRAKDGDSDGNEEKKEMV